MSAIPQAAAATDLYALLKQILWESLDGGTVDLEKLGRGYRTDVKLSDLGIDSLDVTEFLLRVQDRFGMTGRQTDFEHLKSIDEVATFLRTSNYAP